MIVLDYIQDKLLYALSSIYDLNFLLKGGTALYKIYNSGRFSKDIDINLKKRLDIGAIIEVLSAEGFLVRISRKRETENMCFLTLDVSRGALRSVVGVDALYCEYSGEVMDFFSPYPDIPPFKIMVARLSDILADKLDAVVRRKKPRDLYDAYIIVKKYGISIKFKNFSKLKTAIEKVRGSWNSLGELLLVPLPDFKDVKRVILESVR